MRRNDIRISFQGAIPSHKSKNNILFHKVPVSTMLFQDVTEDISYTSELTMWGLSSAWRGRKTKGFRKVVKIAFVVHVSSQVFRV